MNKIRPCAKFIVALAGAATVVLVDGKIEPWEIAAAIVTVGGVYGISNGPTSDKLEE